MNDHAKEALEGFQPGDRVQVVYGNKENLQVATGIIVKYTDNFLKLKDPIANIALEDLRSVGAPSLKPSELSYIQRQMARIPPAKPYQFSFSSTRIKELRSEIKTSCSREVRNIINGVLDKLQAAVKGKALKDKYPEAKKRLMQAWEQCNSDADYKFFYMVLGLISVVAEDYANALEPLVRAKEYQLAAYAAKECGSTDWQEIFYLCAVLNQKEAVSIDQYVLTTCIRRCDIEPLCYLLDAHQNDDDVAACELIASCTAEAYTAAGFHGANVTPLDSALEAAKKIISCFPDSWKLGGKIMKCWKEYESYAYPVPEQVPADKLYTNMVDSFAPEYKRGYIGGYGFHVSQIPDDDDQSILLRRLLSCDQARGLEVSFYLGKDSMGYCVATDIMLTDASLDEAKRRLAAIGNIRHGMIKKYFRGEQRGYISEGGQQDRSFYWTSIIDPYLKAFCNEVPDPTGQFVSFFIGYDKNGKQIAYNVNWEDPKPTNWEQYTHDVSPVEEAAWREKKGRGGVGADDTDDYSEYEYIQLPLWQPPIAAKPKPLTWAVPAPTPTPVPAPTPTPVPVPTPTLVSRQDAETAKGFADRGRQESINGNLSAAEEYLTKALEMGAAPDSIVGTLITIYLRQPEKLKVKATALLNEYANEIQPSKLLNLSISVYDKLKDYAELASLYEEAYQKADTVSKRSHNLFRLIDAYLSLGDYDNALKACKRWETLYHQNRYSSDASKLKNAEPIIERKKAICFYHTGLVEEARHIAIDLLRLNPADQAANAILNGTLTENIAQLVTTEGEETYDPDLLNDEEADEPTPSSIPGFVAAQIRASDVGSILKGSVKDGKYSGDVKKAERDIKELVRSDTIELRGGNTAKTRSDRLFAACKIMEDVEARDGKHWSKNIETKDRLAGRAMALWGDFMVGQVQLMDTPRMAYLVAMSMLPERKGGEQHWANAYTRYIKSYFLGRKDLETYIDEQANTFGKDGPNTDILVQGKLPDVLFAEFFVGILKLLDALKKQDKQRGRLISDLYERNSELRGNFCRHMRLFLCDNTILTSPSLDDFKKYLDRACETLQSRMEDLGEKFHSISLVFLDTELSPSILEQLAKENWAHDLIAADASRLGQIFKLLQRSQDYFANTDFENRAECLRTVLDGVSALQHSIQTEPTELSYDVYLPVLQAFAAKLSEKQDRLYADFRPLLSWGERPTASRTREGTVLVQLKVRNESSHQAADLLRVADNGLGGAVKWVKNSSTIPSLRGGEERDFILELDVTDVALADGSFSLRLCYSFKFNDTPQTVTPAFGEALLSVVLPNAEPIKYEDPYKGHIGNPMKDVKMFYGRDDMIEQLVRMVYSPEERRMKPGHATAIYGQTRCGKSTIFYHLQTELKKEYGDRVIVWDVGNIGEVYDPGKDSGGDLLPYLLYTILLPGEDALCENSAVEARIAETGLESPDEELLFHPEIAASLFSKYISRLNTILKEEDCIIVFLLDEFTYLYDQILKGRLSRHFMKFWKSLLEKYRLFTFVIGQDNMKEFRREFSNEFESMEVIEISYLEETPAKQLIREPLERACGREVFDREAVDALYKLTAGSAYLTMILCSNLVGYLNDRQVRRVTTGIVEDFLNNWMFKATEPKLVEENFEPQMHERGHAEFDGAYKQILTSVALNSQANGWASADAIRRDVSDLNSNALLQRLTDRRILLRNGNQYKILVGLLEQWLIHTEGGR